MFVQLFFQKLFGPLNLLGEVKMDTSICFFLVPVNMALWRAPQDTTFALLPSKLGESKSFGRVWCIYKKSQG